MNKKTKKKKQKFEKNSNTNERKRKKKITAIAVITGMPIKYGRGGRGGEAIICECSLAQFHVNYNW